MKKLQLNKNISFKYYKHYEIQKNFDSLTDFYPTLFYIFIFLILFWLLLHMTILYFYRENRNIQSFLYYGWPKFIIFY